MANKNPFVHLHVHTEYSMLDGLVRIPQLIEKVKSDGMNAVAITDHGSMYGVYELWKACRDEGIKPILGCEVYISPDDMTVKAEVDDIKYYHLILLAKNLTGYRNLIKLVSIGHLEGFYYRPRVDRQVLEKYSEGVICTSGCPAGPIGKHIIRGEMSRAKDWLNFLHRTYGDDFYIEIQRHGLIGSDELPPVPSDTDLLENYEVMKELSKINPVLIKSSEEHKIPLIATADVHYLNAEDESIQDVLFAIKDGKTLDDPTRRRAYKQTYLKTRKEMYEVFSDLPEALENTQKLADSVEEFDITYNRIQPRYLDLPKGKTVVEELREQTYKGAEKKYGKLTEELKDRIEYEIDIIDAKGYSHYYLVTADYVRWARKHNIVVSMRGTGTSSVVAYSLDITSIDPIGWDLMFERFLNPKRLSPPDFDLDLEDQNRDKVIDYVKEKYGEDNVVAICTFGRMQTRAAIRDVSRVMGIDLQMADSLSKMVLTSFGKPKSIKWMMENNREFANIVGSNPQLGELLKTVDKLAGMKRHLSTHACGVLITPKPVTEYVPVQREVGGDRIITQLDLNWIEYAGLLKFDFLGLANLSIIKNTLRLINELRGVDLKTEDIPLDDKATYDLFKRGDTTSVFQFEGGGMKRFLRDLKPDCIEDICFMAAAYRPGPMQLIPDAIAVKHGKKEVEYLLPELEPILEETYGAIIYQEQIMRIAVDIAGYESMGDADLLRRGVAKKKKDVMKKEEPKFKSGMLKNGFSKEQANALWEYLIPFADYGFPKAHSAMYAVVAYWTAYLKVHYPLEFMCARLTGDMSNPDKLKVALEETRQLGIELLPPNINKSMEVFVPEGDNSIRYGFDGIKNVGKNVVEELVKERKEHGEYASLDDLCTRVPSMNTRTLESLIKVGALNLFGEQNALLEIAHTVLETSLKDAKAKKLGQLDIFSSAKNNMKNVKATPLPNVESVSVADALKWEKELLGIYFTAHPMQNHLDDLQKRNIDTINLYNLNDEDQITGACLISNIKRITTKKGDPMAFLTLENMHSSIDGVMFPRDYNKYHNMFSEGDVVVINGRVNTRNGEKSVIVNRIIPVQDASGNVQKKKKGTKSVTLIVHHSATPDDLIQLRDLLSENPGDVNVIIQIKRDEVVRKFKVKNGVDAEVLDAIVSKLTMIEGMKK